MTFDPEKSQAVVHENWALDADCTYTATPRQPTILGDDVHKFPLPADGETIIKLGPYTGLTLWDVVVDCGKGRVWKSDPQYPIKW